MVLLDRVALRYHEVHAVVDDELELLTSSDRDINLEAVQLFVKGARERYLPRLHRREVTKDLDVGVGGEDLRVRVIQMLAFKVDGCFEQSYPALELEDEFLFPCSEMIGDQHLRPDHLASDAISN